MEYTVQHGDTLWEIAKKCVGDATRWKDIARLNHLKNPDHILIGQRVLLPPGAKLLPATKARTPQLLSNSGHSWLPLEQRPATSLPARAFFFVLADEINPFSRKVVRKVVFPKNINGNPEFVRRLLSPEKHGFQPRDVTSKVSPGRHVLGRTDSKFISASERPLGSPRFGGERYWIDANKVKEAGGVIHEAEDIARELDRIAKKTKDPKFLQYIEDIRAKSLHIDKEILIEGSVPAQAVKGAKAMAVTRGLQVVQGVGIAMSVYDLSKAGVQSYQTNSVRPIAAESIRQAGGWGMSMAGAELGFGLGAAVGIETGPGAIITGAVGGLIGGIAGYFGADWIADHIHKN